MSSKVTIGVGVFMCLSLTASASPGITAVMMALVAWEMAPHTVAGADGIKEVTSTEKETAVYHPADLDLNWQMVMSEAIAYLAGWQGGSNPMAYAIRAAFLWQNGEQYHYDAGQDAPLCWALGPVEGEGEHEGEILTIALPEDVILEMVWIPSNSFQMGRYAGEQDSYGDEEPRHAVSVPGFWLGKYEVTKRQWQALMQTTPWSLQPDILEYPDSPAVYVSWNDARDFAAALGTYTGQPFRLPSEAEWECTCRAGTTTRFYWGDDLSYTAINDYAWCYTNAWIPNEHYAHLVGVKIPNSWGVYDMSGNVWEWCEDDWHDGYEGAPADGSAWVDTPRSASRVRRGGSWNNGNYRCRSAYRYITDPLEKNSAFGFRIAKTD